MQCFKNCQELGKKRPHGSTQFIRKVEPYFFISVSELAGYDLLWYNNYTHIHREKNIY